MSLNRWLSFPTKEKTMTVKVGLLVGREWSFPPAFLDEVNGREDGVTAEFVKLGGSLRVVEDSVYRLIERSTVPLASSPQR